MKHLTEIVFVVIMIAMTIFTLADVDPDTICGSIYNVARLLLLMAVYIIGSLVLILSAEDLKILERRRMIVSLVLCGTYGALLFYSCYIQVGLSISELIKLGGCATICMLIDYWALEANEKKLNEF